MALPMALVGRVLLGLYFLLPGILKVTGFQATLAYMHQHHVPLTVPLLALTATLQIGGGVALILGWQTRAIAFTFAGLVLVISVFMHDFWHSYPGGNPAHELQNFIKNLGIMAGLLVLAAHGAPRASIDALRARRNGNGAAVPAS